jgi:hypothetical protein
MPFKATTDGAKVYIQFENPKGTWGNVLWFTKPNFTLADLQALATAVKTAVVDYFVDSLVVGASCTGVTAYDMRTSDGAIVYGSYSAGTGDIAGDPMPLGDCLCVTLYTDKRGRSHRGRMYLAGYSEGSHALAGFDASAQAAAANLATHLKADTAAIGWTWGVHSDFLDGVERDPAVVTPITTPYIRDAAVASQRRRDLRS